MPLTKILHVDGVLAVALPSEFIETHDLKAGEYVYLGKDGANLVIKQNDPRVLEQMTLARNIIKQRDAVLKALSGSAPK
jgi:hypothetical protein